MFKSVYCFVFATHLKLLQLERYSANFGFSIQFWFNFVSFSYLADWKSFPKFQYLRSTSSMRTKSMRNNFYLIFFSTSSKSSTPYWTLKFKLQVNSNSATKQTKIKSIHTLSHSLACRKSKPSLIFVFKELIQV